MELIESSLSPDAATYEMAAQSETYQQCDECGAPVDRDQRYCVSCGNHRRHVNDPAARYLSRASAQARAATAAATARQSPRRRARSRGLGVALAIAIIPVAAAAGVIAGRSSNNQDAKLIQALARHQSTAAVTAAPSTTTAGTPVATKASGHTKGKKHPPKAKASTTPSPKNAGKVITKTQYGTASQITGFKASQAQEQQGAQATQKVQKSTGKSYVNGQSNLPSQVVVP